ncbi:MAG TPA: hypothetical protein VJN64_01370, partial [Terriglobales bacterium]|nr:hypothetical protein [Terriglobales bacterium]
MRKLYLAAFILLCFCALQVNAQNAALQQMLTEKYAGKMLLLRHPITKNSQEYDATGTLLGKESDGPWTVFSGVYINKATLEPDQLKLEANRAVFAYDSQHAALSPIRDRDSKVKLTIRLSNIPASLESLGALMNRVFISDERDLVGIVPDFWKPYIIRRTNGNSAEVRSQSGQDTTGMKDAVVLDLNSAGVSLPKALYTPEPSFSEFAKKYGVHGLVRFDAVIDQKGNVRMPILVQPLGM